MTLKRETKAGLVVSCSFLALLSVVLISKLRDRGPSETEQAAKGVLGVDEHGALVQAPPEPEPLAAAPSLSKAGASGNEIKQIGFVGKGDEIRPMPVASPARETVVMPVPPVTPDETVPSTPPTSEQPPLPSSSPVATPVATPAAVPGMTDPPAQAVAQPAVVAEPKVGGSEAVGIEPAPARTEIASEEKPAVTPTVEPKPEGVAAGGSEMPAASRPTEVVEPRPATKTWGRIGGLRETSPEPEKPPEVPAKKDPFKLPEATSPTTPNATAVASGETKPLDRDGEGRVVLPPPATTVIGPKPIGVEEPRPSANLLRPITAPEPGVAPAPVGARGPVADDLPEPVKLGPVAPPTGEDQFAQAQIPPTGIRPVPAARPGAGLPASTVQTPQVDAYDEMTYRCQPQDTFATVSNRFYRSDKYAKALQMFNRNHPRAADGVKVDPPVLAGQPVYVPPVRILEKQYASFVAHGAPLSPIKTPTTEAPLTGATPPATGTPTSFPPPTPPTPAVQQPGATASWSNPLGEKMYRVRPQGERFIEIAKRTLGNENRWPDVYKLNQRFNPSYPIPAGTVLKLPSDARIDAQDVPR